jgi:hypothetical protein
VPQQCDGLQNADGPHLNNFQTISFSLGKNGEATKYIIDNIKVEIPSDVLSGLTKKPLTKEMSQYPVEITSMAIMGDFLGQDEVNNWNPTNGWALTQDNSNPAIWKLTREFTAVARTYEYKIFANGNMDDFTLPVPADDKGQFVISEAGDYTLTVTVDTEAGTASVRAAVPGTYTVMMKEGAVDAENWTITPTEATTTGVAEGTEVTLQYNGRLKVKGVKAEKKAVAEGHALSASAVGEIVGTDGKAYAVADKDNLPSGVTAVAMIAYVGSSTDHATYKNGLAIALADESNSKWSTAKSTCEGKSAVTNAAWLLPSQNQWKAMFSANGGNEGQYTDLNTAITTAGGTALQGTPPYWSSTPSGYDDGTAYNVLLGDGGAEWYRDYYEETRYRVRACLAF